MIKNILKQKFIKKKSIVGTWSSLASTNVVEVLASTKLDFVIIDFEHGLIDLENYQNMVRTAENYNLAPIIRTQDNNKQHILKLLETGVMSIMVPHIDTSQKAREVVKCSKYFPKGERGISPYTRLFEYDHSNIKNKTRKINENTFVSVLVEGKLGLSNLEEIAKVKGIDMIYFGLFDICQSLGMPGQINNIKVINEIKRLNKILKTNKKLSGSMAPDKKYVNFLKKLGFNFIAYMNDAAALKKFFDDNLR